MDGSSGRLRSPDFGSCMMMDICSNGEKSLGVYQRYQCGSLLIWLSTISTCTSFLYLYCIKPCLIQVVEVAIARGLHTFFGNFRSRTRDLDCLSELSLHC
jgi:hypothetical protein